MGESAQLEVRLYSTTCILNKGLPHKTACRVIREWEVDRLVEELLKLFFGAFVGFACATNDRDPGLVIDPLRSPLGQNLLYSTRRLHVVLLASLLFLLTFLCLCWPHFLALININKRWSVFFGSNHDHGNHLLTIPSVIAEDTLNTQRTDVEDD